MYYVQKYTIVRRKQFSIFKSKKQDFGEKIYKTLVLPHGSCAPVGQNKKKRCVAPAAVSAAGTTHPLIDENLLDESTYYQVIFLQKMAALFTVKTVQSLSLQEFLLPLN